MVCMDVDGTLTDGRIYIGPQGEAVKAFDVKDGQGIKLLQAAGITVAVITARRSEIVENRCRELGITEVYQQVGDKVAIIRELEKKYRLNREQVAYIGDDLGDLSAMEYTGLAFCPADAVESVRQAANVLSRNGGRGAVRQAAERILELCAAQSGRE